MTTETSINLDGLKTLGSEWIKGDMHRIYFNDLAALYGLRRTGLVARLDGEKISVKDAKDLEYGFRDAKLWYDVTTGEFQSTGLVYGIFVKLVARLTERAAAVQVAPVVAPVIQNVPEYRTYSALESLMQMSDEQLERVSATDSHGYDRRQSTYCVCRECGQSGYAHAYPFSTLGGENLCDDCV